MNRDEFHKRAWNYYLMLEKKFIQTLNYVELSTDNGATYSLEYAGLIQLIGSELDSFFKTYCGFKQDERKTILDYYPKVIEKFPSIRSQIVSVPLGDMRIRPFGGWDGKKTGQSLKWWLAFDKIKHSRMENPKEASQRNVIHCLAALFLLEMDYLRQITEKNGEPNIPDEESSLFFLQGWNRNCFSLGKGTFGMISN